MSYRYNKRWEPDDREPLVNLDDWHIPLNARLPACILVAIFISAWLAKFNGGMADWGTSAEALRAGRFETVYLHMIAHAGIIHLAFNSICLVGIGGAVATLLGSGVARWARFAVLFMLSGLAGLVTFLAAHPNGSVPMLGASGAIYGLLGLLLRSPSQQGNLAPLWSPELRRGAVEFVKTNFLMFLYLTVPAMIAGQSGGVAWEAHLGGFLFGLIAAPVFLSGKNGNEQPIRLTST